MRSPRGGSIAREYRVNERIRAREVRVIGVDGEQLGVMPLIKALQLAREVAIDLVEVAPTSTPPVCRLLDYGKFKYEQAKKEREARKGQKVSEVREVRIRPQIGVRDLEFKTRLARRLLDEGDKVKVSVLFRGREVTRRELGLELLAKVVNSLSDAAKVESKPQMEGRIMSMVLLPSKKTKTVSTKEEPTKEESKNAEAENT
ncbi:MAG: translation initiation factor IF-3 [Chloroflexi bacterium]|nr:translation initiation factor IF-3 [Chloroflexota bacterium]